MFKPFDLLTIVVGLACFIVGHYLPDISTTFYVVGAFLVGKAFPQGLALPSLPRSGPPAAALVLFLAFASPAVADDAPVSRWKIAPAVPISLVTHDFTAETTAAGNAPALGAGVAFRYLAAPVPLAAALVVNFQLATAAAPNMFGLGVPVQVLSFVLVPGVVFADHEPPHWLLSVGIDGASLF